MSKASPAGAGQIYAVLTGDIIDSTNFAGGGLALAREAITDGIALFQHFRQNAVVGEPDFFQGDSWQLLLREPEAALRAALIIRSTAWSRKDVDTRVSIGLGTVETIDAQRISLSEGEAFTLSGRNLKNMTHYYEISGALPKRAGALAMWFPVTLRQTSGLIRSWTRRQAEVMCQTLLMDGPTHEEIAKVLVPPVTKQTVTKVLNGANWRSVEELVDLFEATDWENVIGPRN